MLEHKKPRQAAEAAAASATRTATVTPVTREIVSNLSIEGRVWPLIQSQIVGWETPIWRANSAWEVLESSRYFFRHSITPNIGDSCNLSIGLTYSGLLHTPGIMRRDVKHTVWSRVKEALEDARLPATQVYAAKLIEGKQGSVSEWNKPGRFPTIENAVAIGAATNTCVEWILTGKGPKRIGPPDEPTARELWDLWNQLSDITKGRILGIAQQAVSDGGIAPAIDSAADPLQRRSSR